MGAFEDRVEAEPPPTTRDSTGHAPTPFSVREEQPGDHDGVRDVHRAAFGREVVVRLADSLREQATNGRGLSLVATHGQRIIAHAMFTPALLDAPERLVEVQVLSPIGVLPTWQRQGVGTGLIARGIDILTERGVPLVFLEGDPRYYGRLGFVPATEHGFRKPSLRIPDAAFQVRILPAYERWMNGTFVYPDPFWEHDVVGLRDS